MANRLFAAASAVALTGIVSALSIVGCSSSTEATGDRDAGGPESHADGAGDEGKREGGVPRPTEHVAEEGCMKKEPIDLSSTILFKPPRVVPGACSEDDLRFVHQTIVSNPMLPTSGFATLMQERSAACAACIFGKDGDTWPPLLDVGDGKHVFNRGGCVAVVSKNNACGEAYAVLQQCKFLGCEKCRSIEASQDCRSKLETDGGACAEPGATFRAECGSAADAYLAACNTGADPIEATILFQCGPEKADAGSDGGAH